MSEPVEAASDALPRTSWALYDTRTGKRSGMASAGFTREQAERTLQAIRERDARGKRQDIHDLIPHLAVVELTEATWGSLPGDVIGPAKVTALCCRGCVGGWGFADNAHTRDAHCQYGQQKASALPADKAASSGSDS